jgi:hypothetical protein
LGEILRNDGLVSEAAIDRALRAQSGLGGRIGTNLIEMGSAASDAVANALARQKGVPAARQKHFEQVDKSILNLLPKHLAERHSAIPLGVTNKYGRELVVAFLDPDDIAAVDEVGFASSMRVRPSVAPEFYIIHYLERLYGISPRRFLRTGAVQVEAFDYSSGRLPVEAPPRAVTPAPVAEERPPGPDPVRLSTLDEGWDLPEPLPEPPGVEPGAAPAPKSLPQMLSANDAIAHIAAAQTRDEIGQAILAYLMMTFGCGAILICKRGMALGWIGRFPGVDADRVEALSIPLSVPSMFQLAVDENAMFHGGPPAEGDDVQMRVWKLLRCKSPREAIVAPVSIGKRVINVVYAQAADGGMLPDGAAARTMDVCNAAAQGFVRLIKAQKGG